MKPRRIKTSLENVVNNTFSSFSGDVFYPMREMQILCFEENLMSANVLNLNRTEIFTSGKGLNKIKTQYAIYHG